MSSSDTGFQGSVAAALPNLDQQAPTRIAERLLSNLFDDNTICNWCLDHRRVPYLEYDQARLNSKDMRSNSSTINSWSTDFARQDDGTLQVISATSGPSPHAYQDVIDGKPKPLPGESHEDRWTVPDGYLSNPRPNEPPRPKTICGECSIIDVDPTEDRNKREVNTALKHLLTHAEDAGIPHDRDHAIGMSHELLEHDSAQGKDRWVLERSLAYGIEIYRKRQRLRRSNRAEVSAKSRAETDKGEQK